MVDVVPSESRSGERFDVYRTVTDKIIRAIETGVDPFTMPWHGVGGWISRPVNTVTQAAYRGVNVIALWAEAAVRGYPTAQWASYRQWQQIGAQVRQGERGSVIVFFKEMEREDFGEPNSLDTPKLIARASRVFNAAQVEGWKDPDEAIEALSRVNAITEADAFIKATKADIRHGGAMACYHVAGDYIEIPDPSRFQGTPTSSPTESYYGVLCHELTHWSGAKQRLDRQLGKRFGDASYAMEELIAELGAAFLCADLRISSEPRRDHAAYINSWLEVLKSDRKAIFSAASRAQQAAEFLTALGGPKNR